MSALTPLAVLISTVKALRGATLVGENVLASPLNPIEQATGKGGRPTIAVYAGSSTSKPTLRDLLNADSTVEVTIQLYLPEKVTLTDQAGQKKFDAREFGAEFIHGMIGREIMRALIGSSSPWSNIWKEFVYGVHTYETQPFLLEVERGVRVSARETQMICDTCYEPAIGEPVSGAWEKLVDALEADDDDEFSAVGPILRRHIEAPGLLPGWRIVQASLGLTDKAIEAIGFAPLGGAAGAADDGGAPDMIQVSTDGYAGGATTPNLSVDVGADPDLDDERLGDE